MRKRGMSSSGPGKAGVTPPKEEELRAQQKTQPLEADGKGNPEKTRRILEALRQENLFFRSMLKVIWGEEGFNSVTGAFRELFIVNECVVKQQKEVMAWHKNETKNKNKDQSLIARHKKETKNKNKDQSLGPNVHDNVAKEIKRRTDGLIQNLKGAKPGGMSETANDPGTSPPGAKNAPLVANAKLRMSERDRVQDVLHLALQYTHKFQAASDKFSKIYLDSTREETGSQTKQAKQCNPERTRPSLKVTPPTRDSINDKKGSPITPTRSLNKTPTSSPVPQAAHERIIKERKLSRIITFPGENALFAAVAMGHYYMCRTKKAEAAGATMDRLKFRVVLEEKIKDSSKPVHTYGEIFLKTFVSHFFLGSKVSSNGKDRILEDIKWLCGQKNELADYYTKQLGKNKDKGKDEKSLEVIRLVSYCKLIANKGIRKGKAMKGLQRMLENLAVFVSHPIQLTIVQRASVNGNRESSKTLSHYSVHKKDTNEKPILIEYDEDIQNFSLLLPPRSHRPSRRILDSKLQSPEASLPQVVASGGLHTMPPPLSLDGTRERKRFSPRSRPKRLSKAGNDWAEYVRIETGHRNQQDRRANVSRNSSSLSQTDESVPEQRRWRSDRDTKLTMEKHSSVRLEDTRVVGLSLDATYADVDGVHGRNPNAKSLPPPTMPSRPPMMVGRRSSNESKDGDEQSQGFSDSEDNLQLPETMPTLKKGFSILRDLDESNPKETRIVELGGLQKSNLLGMRIFYHEGPRTSKLDLQKDPSLPIGHLFGEICSRLEKNAYDLKFEVKQNGEIRRLMPDCRLPISALDLDFSMGGLRLVNVTLID